MFHKELQFPPKGSVPVSGPFRPDGGERAKSADILFLIVQGSGRDAVTVQGRGTWKAGGPNEWTGTVNRRGVLPGGKRTKSLKRGFARGIAMATVVKPGKLSGSRFDAPTIQSLTWCSDFEFV